MLTLSFSPLVPSLWLWLLGAAAAALVVLAVVSRGPVAVVRALALAFVLLALANPSLVEEEREPVKDIVAVVVDRSLSQTLGDRSWLTARVAGGFQRPLFAPPGG